MLGQRRRRWTNIKPTLGQRPVFAGGGGEVQVTYGKMMVTSSQCRFTADQAGPPRGKNNTNPIAISRHKRR